MHSNNINNKTIENLITQDTKVVVGVSGWCDSMYLLYKLKTFWKEKRYNPDHLHIITCNHNIRSESVEEVEKVRKFAEPYPCTIVSYQEKKKSEDSLRKRRHQEFIKLCHWIQAQYLFLGHHLDDRIETTLLNILRGCGISGIQGMQVEQIHYLDPDITVVRPLLFLEKKTIRKECDRNKIPYYEDYTNTNPLVSQRNYIRGVMDSIPQKESIVRSMQNLYTFLDDKEQWKEWMLKEKWLFLSIKAGERENKALYSLYKEQGITINPRSTTLARLSEQLKKPGSKIHYQWITIRAYSYWSVIEIS